MNKYDDFVFWIIYDGDETMFDQLLNSEFFPGIFLFFQMPIFVFDYILLTARPAAGLRSRAPAANFKKKLDRNIEIKSIQ